MSSSSYRYKHKRRYEDEYDHGRRYRDRYVDDELRLKAQAMINDPYIARLNQYKTSPCCWWSQTKFCPWGTTCCYVHEPLEERRKAVCINYKVTGECRDPQTCKFDHENLDWPESIPSPKDGAPMYAPFLIEPVRSASPLSFLDEDYSYEEDEQLAYKEQEMDKLIRSFVKSFRSQVVYQP